MKYNVQNYESLLSLQETEIAIKLVKDTFERKLASKLDLLRVSAPLFVDPNTGLPVENGAYIDLNGEIVDESSSNKAGQIVFENDQWKVRWKNQRFDKHANSKYKMFSNRYKLCLLAIATIKAVAADLTSCLQLLQNTGSLQKQNSGRTREPRFSRQAICW